jgi:hypothetical protein
VSVKEVSMQRLVTMDLTNANLEAFEAYEARVLPLLGKHGGQLEMRVRSVDGSCETHLLFFPHAQAYQNYLSDPDRVAARCDWERCGAKSSGVEVMDVPM